jgi:PWI domain
VLITGIPMILHHPPGALANWILPCGPARTILWYPKPKESEEKLENKTPSNTMALVTMMHGDGAWKLVYTITTLRKGNLRAHLVPASPEILLPPIVIEDALLADSLINALGQSLTDLENGVKNSVTEAILSSKEAFTNSTSIPLVEKSNTLADQPDDDDAVDPLTTPAVLAAVRAFRKSLEQTSSVQQARRIRLVNERLKQAMSFIRNPQVQSNGALPPGVPPLALPNDMNDPRKRYPALEENYNLNQPPSKRSKSYTPEDWRSFVTEQIIHYLGVEETTLVEFCVQHICDRKSWDELRTELQPVLEEDVDAFLQALKARDEELSGAS